MNNDNFGEYAEISFANQWIKPRAVVIVTGGNTYGLRNWAINISQDGTHYKTINEKKNYTDFTYSYQREIFKQVLALMIVVKKTTLLNSVKSKFLVQ